MNKLLGTLFLALLLILTQSKTLSFAATTTDNTIALHAENETQADIETTHNNKEGEDKDDNDDEDGGNRIISIIPGSTLSAKIKHELRENSFPTITPTPAQTTGTNITPTPTQATTINSDNSIETNASAEFNFIKELQKLLTSLRKIIFASIS